MKSVLLLLLIIVAGFASADQKPRYEPAAKDEILVSKPSKCDFEQLTALLEGKKSKMIFSKQGLSSLLVLAKKGWKLDVFSKESSAKVEGFWFSKNRSHGEGSLIVRIYATPKGAHVAHIQFPAG